MLDIIFLSYDETNADKNWNVLRERFPRAQRLHGIKGVKKAHQVAASLAKTDFFFIVDGDNVVDPTFDFVINFPLSNDTLYVWRCLNPVNQLVYGFGGIKLYNKFLLLDLDRPASIDVATTVAPIYKPILVTASTTEFNSSPFEAWRGAFREGIKLTINVLKNSGDKASMSRLHTWCRDGADRPNGTFCILGARQGQIYAQTHWNSQENLSLINNFDWLKSQYDLLNSEKPSTDIMSSEVLPSPTI